MTGRAATMKPQRKPLGDNACVAPSRKLLKAKSSCGAQKPRTSIHSEPCHGDSHKTHDPGIEKLGNNEATAQHEKQRVRSRRSSSKGTSFSERWSVLTKIIRAQNAIVEEEAEHSGNESEEAFNEDGDSVNNRAGRQSTRNPSLTGSSRCLQYHQHAHSPKTPSPLTGWSSPALSHSPLHHYRNHGLSRSSLSHKRYIWAQRKYIWDEYEHHLETWRAVAYAESAYGGVVYPDGDAPQYYEQPRPPPRTRARTVTEPVAATVLISTCMSPSETENSSSAIYPRVGDISSLHDPFLFAVDSWFCDLPLWTISKLLWVYDLNHRVTYGESWGRLVSRYKEVAHEALAPDDVLPVGYCGSPDLSTCSTETATSEHTLVDISWAGDTQYSENEELDANSPSETLYFTPLLTPPKNRQHGKGLVRIVEEETTSLLSRAWESCWISRWEVLYHQLRLAASSATEDLTTETESPSFNDIKEASRIVLMSGRIYYNLNAELSMEYAEGEGLSSENAYSESSEEGAVSREDAKVDSVAMFASNLSDEENYVVASITSGGHVKSARKDAAELPIVPEVSRMSNDQFKLYDI